MLMALAVWKLPFRQKLQRCMMFEQKVDKVLKSRLVSDSSTKSHLADFESFFIMVHAISQDCRLPMHLTQHDCVVDAAR
jgi:hypothetical protein